MEEGNHNQDGTQSVQKNEGKKQFICGVIEGFYGRPWTTEQRKDLFRKLKKWGMDSYVYAPKDDYKHRAYWRELYTVEEADHLSSLISAAKEHNVTFYYALSPGLDMSYSSQKEIQTLKRKLDQVSQFGCEAFALLFDDIESELSKLDKEAFQTFANAQVSVTNEIYTHLGNPRFLFCPTQYCSSRAVPTVHDSEYLNTLGSKLNHEIDIMWTGNKVISKDISLESIQEITEVLRRPPVIWDNLHANDYDQKRVFLGPYSGRSPELIPHLRGVMTNPNCEFHANTIAIHTLANWSKCSLDAKVNSSLSADIKLETENDDGTNVEELPVDSNLSKNIYHPRVALKTAISEWLPEFFLQKEAFGPITKPQPQVTMVMPIIPIIPSINTCMSLTTTTTTSTNAKVTVPEVNTTQLQALADVCSTVSSSSMNPISNPVMNSLVSPTKVVTNDDILNPVTTSIASTFELPKKIPISIMSVPIMDAKSVPIEGNQSFTKKEEEGSGSTNNDNSDSNAKFNDAILDEEGKQENSLNDREIGVEKCDVDELNVSENNGNGIKEVIKAEEEDVTIEEKPAPVDIEKIDAISIDTVNMIEVQNLSPLSAGNEPMECSSSLPSQMSPKQEEQKNTLAVSEDVVMAETGSMNDFNSSMQVESSEPSPLSNSDMREVDEKCSNSEAITNEDLHLLCDLFYLPFEHGSRGLKLLTEFNWLKVNAGVLLSETKKSTSDSPKPEVAEWYQRADTFSSLCNAVQELLKKITNCANKEICYDLFSYIWDIAGALTLLNAFIKWLSLGHFPHNVYTYIQGSYTWFSKGWKDAFMSGDQEPWVFRGGLIADLQRLMPVDSGNDLFMYKLPELPTSDCHILRPYTPLDETEVFQICTRAILAFDNENLTLPEHIRDLIADSTVGPFTTISPEFCTVATQSCDDNAIIGFAAATVDVNIFSRNVEVCYVPAMREKYAQNLLSENPSNINGLKEGSSKLHESLAGMINDFHNYNYQCPVEVSTSYPAALISAVHYNNPTYDSSLIKRLITITLGALRANGCFGVHVRLNVKDTEQINYYTKIAGFTEIHRNIDDRFVYFGRRF